MFSQESTATLHCVGQCASDKKELLTGRGDSSNHQGHQDHCDCKLQGCHLSCWWMRITCDIQAVVTIPHELNLFLCLNASIVREAVTPAATGCDVMACTCLLDVKVLGVKQAVLPAPEGSIDKEPF